MSVRPATHSGSWYPSKLTTLDSQISRYLDKALITPKANTRILLGPHAGYTYCGEILAQTYKSWDTSKVKNVFILSPSHYVYFQGVRVSKYDYYATPYGNIPVNQTLIKELIKKHRSGIKYMDHSTDDEEHGVEMHLPMFHKLTKDLPQGVPNIIPMLISGSSEKFERAVGEILAQYYPNEEFSFVISSDFCHWGQRFEYTTYTPTKDVLKLIDLSELGSSSLNSLEIPIYKSIECLDKKAMEVASTGDFNKWRDYIRQTQNTICGQKPISIILAGLEAFAQSTGKSDLGFQWNGYSQSSQVTDIRESSVSYASGYITLQ